MQGVWRLYTDID